MNYPTWFRPGMGGGMMIAIIAIIHVFISHFAVGGGLYLVFAERKGLREHQPGILAFTRKHTKFFLLMTMVAGGMTGVAIWFIISLVHPAATSLLIHVFVFGWAIEWVFFLVEVVALFVYYYTFGRMDDRTHLTIGWIYFAAAWLSLFVINGIIDFMLEPGAWVADGNFWSGFFNPLFWPSLAFRTAVSGLLAGVYAFLTTAFLEPGATRSAMTRFSGQWVLGSYAAALVAGGWYFLRLPAPARGLVLGASPTIHRALLAGLTALVAVAVLALVFTLARPGLLAKPVAFLVFISAFIFMGAFEWTREAARRPYVINGVMYSNGILKADVARLDQDGVLGSARWTAVKAADEDHLLEAGRELFVLECYACHTLHGFNNDLAARTRNLTYPAMLAYLKTMHDKRPFMPPFVGSEAEARALAAFITKGIHGKELPPLGAAPAPGGKGQALFEENCTTCHDEALVKTRTAGWTRARIRAALDHLSRLNPGMTEYEGTPQDKDLLADHVWALQGGVR